MASPPYIDPAIAALIARATNVKGNYATSDYNRLFDPMIGVLSNSYTAAEEPEENEQDLIYQYMPTYLSIKDSGYYDEFSIEQSIISSIEEGMPLGKIKQMILNNLDSEQNTNESTSTELLQLATTLDNEYHAYNVARTNKANRAPKKTIFEEAGMHNPEDQYNIDGLLQKGYEKIAQAATPYSVNAQDVLRNKYFQNMKTLAADKERDINYAGEKAELKMRNEFAPYSAGGYPGVTDYFKAAGEQTYKDWHSKNPLDWASALTGMSSLSGVGKPAGDFLGSLGEEIFGGPNVQQKRAAKYVEIERQKATDKAEGTDSPRERNQAAQLLNRVIGTMPKNYVPIRTELVNEQRAERAIGDIQSLRNLVARRVASTGQSPFNDDMIRRALFIASSGK